MSDDKIEYTFESLADGAVEVRRDGHRVAKPFSTLAAAQEWAGGIGQYGANPDHGHDLDPTRIDQMPDHQGCYCNGWQLVSIWCRTHKCFEWAEVQFECIPEEIRLAMLPKPKPSLQVIEGGKDRA